MRTYDVVWLANVTGVDGSERPAYSRIGAGSAYRPDDVFVVGWRDEIEVLQAMDACEVMWEHHNRDDRPSGRTCRSMCMGDVVVVGTVAYACEAMGFRRLVDVPGRIESGTYVEYVAARR